MITYAEDTKHEKIIRTLAMGLALIMYGKEEAADTLIEQLARSKDSILRYGAMFAIGLAYAGTGNYGLLKKLLHFAVSDVSDDVRRAAVINIGLLLYKTPSKIPEVLNLLSESYNPHVRYGATMAIGIGCAGTALPEALKLLAPMTEDKVDFVRQGAFIALSLVFIQTTEAEEPKVATIEKLYEKTVSNRREEILSRMGAVLSTGIRNAAGRNATISLCSRTGNNKMASIVGLAVFTHYWYWYPFLNFMALALQPTVVIGVDSQLKVPKGFTVKSSAKPSQFKYPEFIKEKEKEKKEKVETAVLSTTVRAKAREQRKEAAKMEVDESAKGSPKKSEVESKPEPDVNMEGGEKPEEKKEEEKKEEPTFEML